MSTKDFFPVFGIQDFQQDPQADHTFLCSELNGAHHIDKPHKHDFFLLLLFEQGSGTHYIDFTEYPIREHQMHLLFPGQVHRWDLSDDTRCRQLMIGQSFFERLAAAMHFSYLRYGLQPVVNLSAAGFAELNNELKAIERELNLQPPHWELIGLRTRIVTQLIGRETEQRQGIGTNMHQKPALYQYMSLIDRYYKEHKSVAFYAAQLHISANYLNILCKQYFLVSAIHLIHDRIILESKRLLQTSELSVKEVAYELGFSDLPNFSNFFKSKTGMSPRQFKDLL